MAGKQHCGALESAAFRFCGLQVKLTNGKLTWEYCRPCVNPGAVDSGKPLAPDRSGRGERSPRYRYRVFVCTYRICMEFLGGRRPFFAEGDPRPVVLYKKKPRAAHNNDGKARKPTQIFTRVSIPRCR